MRARPGTLGGDLPRMRRDLRSISSRVCACTCEGSEVFGAQSEGGDSATEGRGGAACAAVALVRKVCVPELGYETQPRVGLGVSL
eukprot:1052936-Prymnesium_polylepis.1